MIKKFLSCNFVFALLLLSGLLLNSHDVNAWQTTDPYFSSSQTFNVYRSYMEVAEGSPYIVNNEHLSSNFHVGDNILGPTDSVIQTKTLFSFLVAGYVFDGDDISKTYHSAQAVLYFSSVPSAYKDFGDVPIVGKYVLTNDNDDNIAQYVNCKSFVAQDTVAPYIISFSIECPQVTIKRQGYHYKWLDITVGSLDNNDISSDYYYRYRDGGGFKITPAVGQYIVSSSDNASELALEQITNQNETIINQNETIINQNQEVIDQNNQDREDFQNQVDSSEQSSEDLADDVTNASSSLLNIIGNFINIVLNPPRTDCRITLDVGNANFGQADLCSLSLPQPLAVVGTLFVLAMIITITVSLIMTFLGLLKGATQG